MCSSDLAVGEDGTLGLGDRDFAEPHAASARISLMAGKNRVSVLGRLPPIGRNIMQLNHLDAMRPSLSAAESCAVGSGMAGEFSDRPFNGFDRT